MLQVQRCTLLSIKTGGCPETCNYCAQSSSWSKETKLKAEKLMGLDEVYEVRLECFQKLLPGIKADILERVPLMLTRNAGE